MIYLALDPGATTGWAMVTIEDRKPKMQGFGQLNFEELVDWFDNEPAPGLVIFEDFRLFSHRAKQQSGSTMPASKAIGVIEAQCYRWQIKAVAQPSSILPIAQKWSGLKIDGKGGHAESHWKSAYNHAIYYLQKNNLIKSRALG